MKWFKVDVNELLFPDCSVEELFERLKIRALCAQYEGIPPAHITKNSFGISPEHELLFIQSDINTVVSHRKSVQVAYKRQTDGKNDSQSDSKTDGADKIILDKIILDNNKKKVSKDTKEKYPKLSEVENYVTENNLIISAYEFWSYYEQVGWVKGKDFKPIKNWKLTIQDWNKRELEKTQVTLFRRGDIE